MKKIALVFVLLVFGAVAESKYPSEEIIRIYEIDLSKADKLDIKTTDDVKNLKNLDKYGEEKDEIYITDFKNAYHNKGVTVIYNDKLSQKEQFNYLLDALKAKASSLEGVDKNKLKSIIELLRVK